MTNAGERWKQRQKMLEGRTGRFRVDACRILRAEDGYRLVCTGMGMIPAISPPRITVGGLPVREVQFLDRGRRIEAVLPEPPRDSTVLLDFVQGVAKVEAARDDR
ncbi:MAG TPA: hypothetical protein PLH75_03915 [Amaricoccus sp.]|uniref:hypothetical protein n=1 Tax=Amaricoccus sp. TaxID=1872485 RepID=UPI001D70C8C2|nr:hypothetical protein [Amaricoccus sp.]MCB1373597.1 hypothetical protein [Paracoccaceae bacterium]MCB1402924.1 hypothetical protein [Paracoccaceae bacterium]HPG21918.1 hypothetical protein [Amaricoccus sp.]HRW15255.1 hypothetical protein [Amaricoccus sp.]